MTHLVGDANNTASGTSASVTSLLRLLVSALAEVISSSVNDNGAANDALGANQLDQLVRGAALSVTLTVGLEVTQVTNVALVVFGRAVRLVVGVDWMGVLVWYASRWLHLQGGCSCVSGAGLLKCRYRYVLTVRTSRRATVCVIAESVNVHATLSIGVVASDVP